MKIPGFEIIASLGAGATAEVFEARNLSNDNIVALKVFAMQLVRDQEGIRRLENEVAVLKQLNHPNVVGLKGIHQKDGEYFALELDLVNGQDLRCWSEQYDFPMLEPKLWLLSQVARALGAAHERGILHRDLKPENVLVSNSGLLKITDFGLARLVNNMTITRMGLLVGSLAYMAPELLDGGKASASSDIFSFGVLAYELLANENPYCADTPQAIIKNISQGRFSPLHVRNQLLGQELADLIDRCLSVDPKDRPESIWELEAVLLTKIQAACVLPLCRELCAEKASEKSIAQALQLKHQSLKQQTQEWLDAFRASPQPHLRRKLLFAATQLQKLFPNDSLANSIISELSQMSSRLNRKRRLSIFSISGVVLMLFASVAWFYYSGYQKEQRILMEKRQLELLVAKQKAAEQKRVEQVTRIRDELSRKQAAIVAAKAKKTKSESTKHKAQATKKMGVIHFEVDDDVAVFVDGRKVPNRLLFRYPVAAGRRSVKLVKRGFMPIVNSIEVKEGKTANVRARTQGGGDE